MIFMAPEIRSQLLLAARGCLEGGGTNPYSVLAGLDAWFHLTPSSKTITCFYKSKNLQRNSFAISFTS